MDAEILEETTSEENIVTVETIPQSLTSEEISENVFQNEIDDEDGNLPIKCLKYLPVGYNYIILEEKYESDTNFEVEFRCNIKTEDEAKQWMEVLSERSYVTWRIGKTHPDAGRYNVFKIEYRCRHKGAHKPKEGSSRRSYNTQCPAWLTLTIKRYVEKSRARRLDDETAKENPCIIRLKNIHNHQIGTSEVLRIRDVSEQVKEKLRALYRAGYTPLNAHNKLHMDAMIEHGEDYFRIAADRRFCPNKSFCYDLYYAEFKKSCRSVDVSSPEEPQENAVIHITDIPGVFDVNQVILENDDQQQPTTTTPETSSNLNLIPIMLPDESNQAIIIIQQQLESQPKIKSIDHVTGDLEQCLNEIYSRLTSPPITAEKISAMMNFVSNYKQNAQSEANLISSAHNFAKIDNLTRKRKEKVGENKNNLTKKRKSYPANRRTTSKQQTHVVISSKEMHSYTHLE